MSWTAAAWSSKRTPMESRTPSTLASPLRLAVSFYATDLEQSDYATSGWRSGACKHGVAYSATLYAAGALLLTGRGSLTSYCFEYCSTAFRVRLRCTCSLFSTADPRYLAPYGARGTAAAAPRRAAQRAIVHVSGARITGARCRWIVVAFVIIDPQRSRLKWTPGGYTQRPHNDINRVT